METIDDIYAVSTNVLGTGSFSTVYSGTIISGENKNQTIAVKKISFAKSPNIDKIKLEIEINKNLHHDSIVKYYGVHYTSKYCYIFMEFCNYGTLNDVITYHKKIKNKSTFNIEENTYYYLEQLKNAMQYIHNIGYIHRDIKPLNVLLTKCNNLNLSFDETDTIFKSADFTYSGDNKSYHYKEGIIVKLADFGMARLHNNEDDNQLAKTICGSPLYMAPELILDNKYNQKSDLWSCGMVMYELLYGINPMHTNSLDKLKSQLKTKDILFSSKILSNYCIKLLSGLLNKKHEARTGWKEFFEHSWFDYWKTNIGKVEDGQKASPLNNPFKLSIDPLPSLSPLGESNLSKMKFINPIFKKLNYESNGYSPYSYPSGASIQFMRQSLNICKSDSSLELKTSIQQKQSAQLKQSIRPQSHKIFTNFNPVHTIPTISIIPTISTIPTTPNILTIPIIPTTTIDKTN